MEKLCTLVTIFLSNLEATAVLNVRSFVDEGLAETRDILFALVVSVFQIDIAYNFIP